MVAVYWPALCCCPAGMLNSTCLNQYLQLSTLKSDSLPTPILYPQPFHIWFVDSLSEHALSFKDLFV